MFAIINNEGKQLRITKGETVRLSKISASPGDLYETDKVLCVGGGDTELKLGHPYIDGARVEGTIILHGKDKKVIVFKRKRRKTYRMKYGHRQIHTLVKIEKIMPLEPKLENTNKSKGFYRLLGPMFAQ